MKENKKSEPESEPELCQNGIGCNTESHDLMARELAREHARTFLLAIPLQQVN
jgi:hypothetical protein